MEKEHESSEKVAETVKQKTPSMFMSLVTLGVMAGLILFSVFLFGEEVADGPLQISITLATMFALGVAHYYGFRGALITDAISKNVNSALGTIFILIAIGAIIGSLYLSGTVAAFIYYGVELLNPRFFYISVFIIASILSILTGSSFTTVGALGVAFVGLATIMGVSEGITAGAVISGAFLGDKIAKISDTLILTTAVVGGVSNQEHQRMVIRTAIIPVIISALLFFILGFTESTGSITTDPSKVQSTIAEIFNVTPLAFIPVIMIFVLSSLRLSGFISLMVSAIIGVALAAFTQPHVIVSMADNANLNYAEAVFKAGISTFAEGFHLNSGNEKLDTLFSGGGTWGMFETIWLILMAASFGGILDYTGMIQRVISPVINWSKSSSKLVFSTALTGVGLNIFAADPYVSIVLSGKMYRQEYIRRGIKPVVLSTTIADSGTMFSALIPWNVNGAFVAAAMGIGVMSYAPYAFMCYISLITIIVLGFFKLRKNILPAGTDVSAVYGREPVKLPGQTLSA
jgi:NhaC family Na+:H+ antiporter